MLYVTPGNTPGNHERNKTEKKQNFEQDREGSNATGIKWMRGIKFI